jgi:hypothetical protein
MKKKTEPKKNFDCVEMMHKCASLVRNEMGDCTLEEEIQFWREGTDALKVRQAQLRQAKHPTYKKKRGETPNYTTLAHVKEESPEYRK